MRFWNRSCKNTAVRRSWRGRISLILLILAVIWAYSWIRGAWSHSAHIQPAIREEELNRSHVGDRYPDKHELSMDARGLTKIELLLSQHQESNHTLSNTLSTMTYRSLSNHSHTAANPPSLSPPVLDTKGIKIVPKRVTVPEGHALKLTCVSTHLLYRQGNQAPYMTFEFPPMSSTLERNILITLAPGMYKYNCLGLRK